MTPTFINANSHYVYVDLPSREDEDLTRIRALEKIDVSGADADALEGVNGLVNLDTADDDTKEAIDAKIAEREAAGIAIPGRPDPSSGSSSDDASTTAADDGLDDKSLTELRKLARGKVKGYSKLKKAKLIAELRKLATPTSTDDSSGSAEGDKGGGGTVTTSDVKAGS